jgi:hypothetical protein
MSNMKETKTENPICNCLEYEIKEINNIKIGIKE